MAGAPFTGHESGALAPSKRWHMFHNRQLIDSRMRAADNGSHARLITKFKSTISYVRSLRHARLPARLALRHGCPISMAPTPARNGNGMETAARSQTTRGGIMATSQLISRVSA